MPSDLILVSHHRLTFGCISSLLGFALVTLHRLLRQLGHINIKQHAHSLLRRCTISFELEDAGGSTICFSVCRCLLGLRLVPMALVI